MKKLALKILNAEDGRTLAALAAFNNITVEECAVRILSDSLKSLREEMNFHGQMVV